MSNIADAILKQRKHKGHSGGLEGCPICSRATDQEIDTEFDLSLTDDQPLLETTEPAPEESPIRSRIASILGHK